MVGPRAIGGDPSIRRVELQGPIEIEDRLLELPLPEMGLATIAEGVGPVRVDRYRSVEVLNRAIVPSGVGVDGAPVIVGPRQVWVSSSALV